jgi:hypothetical protein
MALPNVASRQATAHSGRIFNRVMPYLTPQGLMVTLFKLPAEAGALAVAIHK